MNATTEIFELNHRSCVVRVKKVLSFPGGNVRVAILEGEDVGCTYVVSSDRLKAA